MQAQGKDAMPYEIPSSLANRWNQSVFDFLRDYSAHSDVTEALARAVRPLGDVQHYCPDLSRYRYVVVSTKGVVFGFAIGMNGVAFRLNAPFHERALATGGSPIPELGDGWVSFTLFRDGWPEVDLPFWAQKAYVYARETLTA
jgi:hypothetical protein